MAVPGQHKVQPKDDVGTRKGFKRYKWELKDSNKEFWLGGHAVVKIVSVACLSAGLHFFGKVTTNPILILVLTMEISIFAFFIFLYIFAINRYMPFIFWPVAEIFNNLFSCVFLGGGIAFSLKTKRVFHEPYITALVLMAVAAFFALVDICLQFKYFRNKKGPN
ncbi:CKLF-like MARVEL transmembrane domain-containing protein 2 [Onychomys torridus]|uniref:CKLF-like MARVEL transmembrane domain-containing protein 2 n=1 Tax=Onychomys torridus TaxID=38674 RepID=UPI00167FA054|nr:CKLF-like MARVEL transmembrane domain-containing protein 2 [Onychomys torridus]